MPDFLLHSLASFDPLIPDVLDAVGARTVVEIGGEGGTFTETLVARAERVDGSVHCIDPAPSEHLVGLASRKGRLQLVREVSPDVFERLPAFDAYMLDGDHNYWTVAAELAALQHRLEDDDRPAVAVLHDVGWPWARRDQYYAPDRLPKGAVAPHTWTGGPRPGNPGVAEAGFSSAGEWAFARREGGPRNGVLTAVEDHVAAHADLELRIVPVVFGLGVLFSSNAVWADAIRAVLDRYDSPLLSRLEANRIELYLEVLRLQEVLEHRARVHQLQLTHQHAASRS